MKNRSQIQNTATPASTGFADPVPAGNALEIPSTFVARKLGRGLRGFKPQRAQLEVALKAVAELRGPAQYEAMFGKLAPAKGETADALESASGWSAKVEKAKAFLAYARQQEVLAWERAGSLLDALRVPFELGQQRDASVTSQYPTVSKFFSVAKRGAKGRKAGTSAKAQPAPAAPPPAAETAPAKQ